ncbi:MAG: hypothetical protein JSU63_00480 [Phycisphaerales bacterium]|nr:MAG: hypothetical protein JSU63_00480 [Phycisphaerales bacterium]
MYARLVSYGLSCMISVFLVTLLEGCSGQATSESTKHETAKPVKADGVSSAQLVAKLAKADRLDGKVDKIVTRCASCAFNMDGKPEHTLKAEDYTLHFCTETCAQQFAKNLTKSVLAMNIPEDSPAKEPAPKPEERETLVRAQIAAKLAAADLLDGKADKTVVRCASCALGMDGSAEHALKAHDYTLHFCRAGCAERFGKDIDASILAMEIPKD